MEQLQAALVQGYLTAIVRAMGCVPREAAKVDDDGTLPRKLQQLATGGVNGEAIWSAWSTPRRRWFFRAEHVTDELGAPVVNVHAYSREGHLVSSTVWVRDGTGEWLRTSEQARRSNQPARRPSQPRTRLERSLRAQHSEHRKSVPTDRA